MRKERNGKKVTKVLTRDDKAIRETSRIISFHYHCSIYFHLFCSLVSGCVRRNEERKEDPKVLTRDDKAI